MRRLRDTAPALGRLPRERSRHTIGLLVSLAVHAAVIALVVSGMTREWTRTPAPGPIAIALPRVSGGGGGGNREAYITPPAAPAPRTRERLAPPKPPPEPPTVEPPVVLPPPEPIAAPPDTQPSVAVSSIDTAAAAPAGGAGVGAGRGPGTGGGAGGGTGTGQGSGTGPGGAGEGGRSRPPEPRQLVIPPADFPKELRGQRLEVTFFVAADGRVEHVDVVPPIAHGGFARKFEETMRQYRFRPARSPSGVPIAGSTTITVSF